MKTSGMWRDLKGVKQDELARMLGISAAALSHIENNITELTLRRIEDIADTLGLKPAQLLENPHQVKNLHNNTNTGVSFGHQHNTNDKELIGKVVSLIDNMQLLITENLQRK